MRKGMKAAAAVLGAAAATVGGAWYAYREAFGADSKRLSDSLYIPEGGAYEPYRERSMENIQKLLDEPFERLSILSHDGLRLRGKYYPGEPGKPVLLFFHGYRSTAERDGSGGFTLCRKHGWGALMVDQRAHGESEGKTITFGVEERYDCLDWCRAAVRRFGEDTPLFLVGVSMGAATVLMAADLDLPPQVKGIWADCGYSSPKEILCLTAKKRRLPQKPAWALMRLGGRMFGKMDVTASTALESVKNARIPILIIHGEADEIVPHDMALALRDACAAPVTFVSVPGAPHGMSFYAGYEAYTTAVERLIFDQLL